MTFRSSVSVAMALLVFVSACSGGGRKGSEWDNIDYSKVRQIHENDTGYVQPTVIGCTDDDLFNCNK